MAYQITIQELLLEDTPLEPMRKVVMIGHVRYTCPICKSLIGGEQAGEKWRRNCPNGHKINWGKYEQIFNN